MDNEVKELLGAETVSQESVSSEAEPKPYEIGYLLTPLLPEEEAGKMVVSMRLNIESKGGMIVSEAIPEMCRLAYPIEKHSSGYFGWMKFILKPSVTEEVQKFFRGEKNIIRFILIHNEKKESNSSNNHIGVVKKTNIKPRIPEVVEKDSGPIDIAEIDKKLEELVHEEAINV